MRTEVLPEEVCYKGQLVVRFTDPVRSVRTAYSDMLAHMELQGYQKPRRERGGVDEKRVQFDVGRNLALSGYGKQFVYDAFLHLHPRFTHERAAKLFRWMRQNDGL